MSESPALKDQEIDLNLIRTLPLNYLKNNLFLPIGIYNGGLKGYVCNPSGLFALRELASIHRVIPEPIQTTPEYITNMINRIFSQIGSAQEVMDRLEEDELSSVATEFESPKDLLELTEEAPIIRLLNALIQQAIKEKASDIHIEPYERELEVRFRIDGILREVIRPPKIIKDALISRVKIMAGLDIAEKRLPQDGRIRLIAGGRDIDIRVSIVPTTHGERAVLRILDRQQGLKGLWELGLSDTYEKAIEGILKRPNGIMLVTGPTGSGKTTTLYAALNRIEKAERNIITAEDPVEYQLKGVGQIQVNPKIGLTFASALRSILRQDPDVIMVGEIRDLETAEIAIQASLTGHLVLSTLHTNDSASAVTRLLDMEIEPFLIASSLTAVLAQRLVRTICVWCKEAYEPSLEELAYFDGNEAPKLLYRGKGCPACAQSGYSGRTGIFELLLIDNDIRRLITARSDAQGIKEQAISKGMQPLFKDGLLKVSQGITTLEEVLRVSLKDYVEA
jgi:general secretion pathway protein E